MEPLAVLLVLVLLAGAAALAGHAIARSSLPLRREMWRRRIDAIEREADELQHEDELDADISDRLARTSRPGIAFRAPEVVPNQPGAAPENAGVYHQPASESDVYEAQADELEARAHRERVEAERADAEASRLRSASATPPDTAPPEAPTHGPAPPRIDDTLPDVLHHRRRRRLRRRRRAGLAPEDLDY